MPTAPQPTDTDTRMISIRIPIRLERQLESLAQRDNNGKSATVRRLLSMAISQELAVAK